MAEKLVEVLKPWGVHGFVNRYGALELTFYGADEAQFETVVGLLDLARRNGRVHPQ